MSDTVDGGLNGTRLRFDGDWGRGYPGEYPGVLLANGVFTRTINDTQGDGNGVRFQEDGGFGAFGGSLTVTLNGNAELQFGDNNNNGGLRDNSFFLGSQFADNMVTFTNAMKTNQQDRYIRLLDNPNTDQDVSHITGKISSSRARTDQSTFYIDNVSNRVGGTLWIESVIDLGDHQDSRIHINDGVVRMDASVFAAANPGRLRFEMNADDADRPAVWESKGTVDVSWDDVDDGTIRFEDRGGGFAAFGGKFTLNLEGGITMQWDIVTMVSMARPCNSARPRPTTSWRSPTASTCGATKPATRPA